MVGFYVYYGESYDWVGLWLINVEGFGWLINECLWSFIISKYVVCSDL